MFEASRILTQFYQQLSHERYLAFNPGLALGGTGVTVDTTGTDGSAIGKRNVIAERMVVTGDLRTLVADSSLLTRSKSCAISRHTTYHTPRPKSPLMTATLP